MAARWCASVSLHGPVATPGASQQSSARLKDWLHLMRTRAVCLICRSVFYSKLVPKPITPASAQPCQDGPRHQRLLSQCCPSSKQKAPLMTATPLPLESLTYASYGMNWSAAKTETRTENTLYRIFYRRVFLNLDVHCTAVVLQYTEMRQCAGLCLAEVLHRAYTC